MLCTRHIRRLAKPTAQRAKGVLRSLSLSSPLFPLSRSLSPHLALRTPYTNKHTHGHHTHGHTHTHTHTDGQTTFQNGTTLTTKPLDDVCSPPPPPPPPTSTQTPLPSTFLSTQRPYPSSTILSLHCEFFLYLIFFASLHWE